MTGARQFDIGLAATARGERYVYHVGLLMADRQRDIKLDSVATAAWKAWMDGRCVLVQRPQISSSGKKSSLYLAWKL